MRFLATEYSTGKTHAGRIDTLGIDENGCPVIIESKRSTNENVINQGLFDPDTVELEDGFTRDMRHIGHFGTGDLDISLGSMEDFERAELLLEPSYDAS